MSLTINMRAHTNPWFLGYLLRVGDGLDEMVDDLHLNRTNHDYIISRAILTTKNENVDVINDELIGRFQGKEKVYYSFDEAVDDTNNYYPLEFLNSLIVSGLPPLRLHLKIRFPVTLLHNLDSSNGLCQTIPNVGVYLLESVFSHGHVALSRGVSQANAKLLVKPAKKFGEDGVYPSVRGAVSQSPSSYTSCLYLRSVWIYFRCYCSDRHRMTMKMKQNSLQPIAIPYQHIEEYNQKAELERTQTNLVETLSEAESTDMCKHREIISHRRYTEVSSGDLIIVSIISLSFSTDTSNRIPKMLAIARSSIAGEARIIYVFVAQCALRLRARVAVVCLVKIESQCILLIALLRHPSETKVLHNEDGNPARANIKQALGSYERSHKGVKASANSDIVYFFTSAQDGDPLQDDVRLCLGDDLKKAQDHNQRQVKDESKDHYPKCTRYQMSTS
ncbi:ATP-dependent DNA helicase PIF1-like protein [Tanacetum coccineum]|uniref:ATP-dependent DNA helicase PIF1-like protein n=1 Tax=Tanacetum coccineum TaxID=301880 RepID=A0ABQ5F2H7_9ASTR